MSNDKQKFSDSEKHLKPILDDLNRKQAEPNQAEEEFSQGMSHYLAETEYQSSLRKLVDSWIAAGHDYRVWSEKNADEKKQVENLLESVRFRLMPEESGRARLAQHISTSLLDDNRSLDGFIKIITSSLFDRIGRCKRCGRYYLARTAHKSRYCSRSCGSAATAVETTRKRLQRERGYKINRVRKAIGEFRVSKLNTADWKGWVANRTGVTRKWITQAYNRGELPNAKVLAEKKER